MREGLAEVNGKPESHLEANHSILDGVRVLSQGNVEDGASVAGRVKIGKGSVFFGRSVVRGPAIIGENCKMGQSAYIGPYTVIGDRCHVTVAEVDDSIVMDDKVIDIERKLVRSMVGKGTKILSANGLLPKSERLVVGENTTIYR